jgi:methylglutaconyl-CoA hydratase
MEAVLREEIENRICRLTLQRPEKRNALNPALVAELTARIAYHMQEADTRVIVLEGAGEAFCAGADLAYLQEIRHNSREENIADSMRLKALYELILSGPKPVIAAVHGPALAGGCGLANACDFCFATPAASFGYTETKIGFIPALVSVFLQRKINGQQARELLLSGRILNANEARELGMVSRITEAGNLMDEVLQFAGKLAAQNSGEAIALTKRLLWQSSGLSIDEGMNLAAAMNAEARSSADCIRGIDAFLNKEKISW